MPFPRRPEFPAVPAEPSAAQQLADLRSRVDAATRLIDEQVAKSPAGRADGLLDIRNELHPPARVPVIPGRAT